MAPKRLHDLLSGLEDLGEIVLLKAAPEFEDALVGTWRRAAADAAAAYEEWRAVRTLEAYAAYRACADRADAAQDALAARAA